MLVRHGQGYHNVKKNYSIEDPELTEKGRLQAEELRHNIDLATVELIVVSPLTRAIQTAQIAWGEMPRVPVHITALHSERVNEPCDMGRPKSKLEGHFPFLRNWGGWAELPERWTLTKEEDKNWQAQRVPAFLEWLRNRPERRIAVVGHGEFFYGMTEALGKPTDLRNCEVKILMM